MRSGRLSERAGPVETRLMALSVATKTARVASEAEAEALIERVNWDALARELARQRLLGIAGERILAQAASRAPESFITATAAAIRAAADQDAILELLSIQFLQSLRAAGIKSVPLKGPALGRAVYGKPGRRPSGDIDLLVAREDLFAAGEVIRRLGFAASEGSSLSELPRLHLSLVRPALPPVELHWRVHWYEERFSRDLLMRSIEESGWTRPTLIDELTSLLLYYARDGFVGLRLACDLAAWSDRYRSELRAGALEDTLSEYPALERALLASLTVAQKVVSFPAEAMLDRPHPLIRRCRLAVAIRNPLLEKSSKQQIADINLVDWLLTPKGGQRESIRRQLHPASEWNPKISPSLHSRLTAVVNALRLVRRSALTLTWVGRAAGRRRSAST